MNTIEAVNLTKKYRDTVAVDNVNFTVKKGELVCLLGMNGAGKTTTLKMLSCLTKPTLGDAYIAGYSVVSNSAKVKSVIGVSPQESAVAYNLSVKENLDLICGIHGFTKEKRTEKIKELCDKFDLHSVLNKKAGTLSGGWQRRLSIAMAPISEPKVLFLDEPTLGLDVIVRSELWDMILELKGKTTIVLTTHYMEEAQRLSDKILIMKNGKIAAQGSAESIKESVCADKFEDAFIAIVKEGKK